MAEDYLLEFGEPSLTEGGPTKFELEGESKDKEHPKTIELLSFSWGVHAHSYAPTNEVTRKRQHEELACTGYVSKASPKLAEALVNNKNFKKVTLYVRKAVGEAYKRDYLKIILENVRVSKYAVNGVADLGEHPNIQIGGRSGTTYPLPLDRFSLSYNKIKLEYREQLKGGNLDAPVLFEDNWGAQI